MYKKIHNYNKSRIRNCKVMIFFWAFLICTRKEKELNVHQRINKNILPSVTFYANG